MFEKILVPLDGSELSEIALPYAEELAGRLDSAVTLLHVCKPVHEGYQHMHRIYLGNRMTEFEHYVKRHFPKSTASVKGENKSGPQPEVVIGDYVQANNIGMIVMATHGASGLKTIVLGSVADKVVRSVPVPTLLIRTKPPEEAENRRKLVNRILVPLDGSEASKEAIPYAEDLARKLKASIHLFRMTRSSYSYAGLEGMAGTVSVDLTRIDRAEEKRIHEYLGEVADELRKKDIPVTYSTVLSVDPGFEIIELCGKVDADLVVMSTRGRSPLARWMIGSTAEKVLREGQTPLLLIRQTKS
jgi:nucleotide-binding universal stress UspA family protein